MKEGIRYTVFVPAINCGKSKTDKLIKLYDLIKEKRDKAQWDYNFMKANPDLDPFDLFKLEGQISAYNDILSLMEGMGIK